jgi:hypothetical protein
VTGACIANAIFNITGVRIDKLPPGPENVSRGLKAAEKHKFEARDLLFFQLSRSRAVGSLLH